MDASFTDKSERFIRTPQEMQRQALKLLGCSAFKLYSVVVSETVGWGKEEAIISISRFMEQTNIASVATIEKAIAEMISKGFVQRRKVKWGGGYTFVYKLGVSWERAGKAPEPPREPQEWNESLDDKGCDEGCEGEEDPDSAEDSSVSVSLPNVQFFNISAAGSNYQNATVIYFVETSIDILKIKDAKICFFCKEPKATRVKEHKPFGGKGKKRGVPIHQGNSSNSSNSSNLFGNHFQVREPKQEARMSGNQQEISNPIRETGDQSLQTSPAEVSNEHYLGRDVDPYAERQVTTADRLPDWDPDTGEFTNLPPDLLLVPPTKREDSRSAQKIDPSTIPFDDVDGWLAAKQSLSRPVSQVKTSVSPETKARLEQVLAASMVKSEADYRLARYPEDVRQTIKVVCELWHFSRFKLRNEVFVNFLSPTAVNFRRIVKAFEVIHNAVDLVEVFLEGGAKDV